ncbi:cupin domain-containing protein [Shewanella sp. AS1]|uniref:cupin domain-containing protein n=1 Tax=Shewanella sp. AS1 TaxID=2907626 RepID=UPI001F2C1037|nr:cupin domain-containing protein [Shewanella sp. AS1]MCE9677896.1 cupin domain-containing protein [Shewanella sp. AS1]
MIISVDDIINFSQRLTQTEHYEVAREKWISGDPKQQVKNHYSSPCGQFHAGIWQGDIGSWRVNYSEHEYCEILAGRCEITDKTGNSISVGQGDRFVIPAGFSGIWKVIDTCKKVYVVFEQK